MSEPVSAYSIETFARAYSIGRTLVFAEIKAGRLKARKAGRRTLILRDDAEAWAASAAARKTENMEEVVKSTQTAIGAKFAEVGIYAHEVRFRVAIAELLNNGGTIERAHAMIDEVAYEMGSEGRFMSAVKGLTDDASASRPDDGGEVHSPHAVKARDTFPTPPSPDRSVGLSPSAVKAGEKLPTAATQRAGAGHEEHADKASVFLPRSGSARHNPGVSRRGASAIASVQATIAKSLFDSVVLPDGRKVADIPWHELPKIATEYRRLSRICMKIYNRAVPTDQFATARQTMKEDDFKQIVDDVERVNDIA